MRQISDDVLAEVSGGNLGNLLRSGAVAVMNLTAGETSPDLRPQLFSAPAGISTPGSAPALGSPIKLPGGATAVVK